MAFYHSNFMLQSSHEDDTQPSTSLAPILAPYTAQEFQGLGSIYGKRPSMAFSTGTHHVCEEMNPANNNSHHNHGEDELSDDGSEKKRRLNMEQVRTLEKNFELGNKLEPERKMQLARDLGLQPRQIAIWFQNRRARWKTKQLEKDYDLLKRQFEAAKAENDALHSQNKKLHAEILALKTREPTESINLNKETEGSCSNRSENSSEIKLEISRTTAIDSPFNAKEVRPGPFPSAHVRHSGAGVAHHLLHTSSRPEIQGPRMDHQGVKEESSFCNMFCGIDDQTGFWPWLEQHNFG